MNTYSLWGISSSWLASATASRARSKSGRRVIVPNAIALPTCQVNTTPLALLHVITPPFALHCNVTRTESSARADWVDWSLTWGGRAAGQQSVARGAAPPRAPPRPAAVTLRANHTPNNAALLLRFIWSCIGLMVSAGQPYYYALIEDEVGARPYVACCKIWFLLTRYPSDSNEGCLKRITKDVGDDGRGSGPRAPRTCVGTPPGNPLLIPAFPLSKEFRRRCCRRNSVCPDHWITIRSKDHHTRWN